MIEMRLKKLNTDYGRVPIPNNAIPLQAGNFAVIEFRQQPHPGDSFQTDWIEVPLVTENPDDS